MVRVKEKVKEKVRKALWVGKTISQSSLKCWLAAFIIPPFYFSKTWTKLLSFVLELSEQNRVIIQHINFALFCEISYFRCCRPFVLFFISTLLFVVVMLSKFAPQKPESAAAEMKMS